MYLISGKRNKWKGNGAGLAWESQSHCYADEFGSVHMTTVKEVAEQCRQLLLNLNNE